MKKYLFSLLLTIASALAFDAQDLTAKFDKAKMRERVVRLSSDEFEGRGPGTAGGKLAAQYIADELSAAGVRPANKGSYFQNVKLVGVKADPNTNLTVERHGAVSESFRFGDDFVATTSSQAAETVIAADLVFVGYGIDAPNYRWNDYKGDPSDYRGKVLMIMVNDPPATPAEPMLFGDKALTYYGRWTYKFEEAARRGAAGVILIHTQQSAGYGWNVVRTSNGGWRYEVARSHTDKVPYLDLKAWVTDEAAKKIISQTGLDLDDLRTKARSRDFVPVETGLKVKIRLRNELKSFESPNVVGVVEGRGRRLKNEYVVYTAHWDHLGVGEPDAAGDRIFNGARDNSSGVAAVLGIAEVLAKLPKRQRPQRSVLFLFPTAEEQGLLGAEYYSLNPLFPVSKTAGNINMDGVNFFGKTSDFSALGSERSTLNQFVSEAAGERQRTLKGDSQPEQGFFFRSDHFPFARAGVPAISLRAGDAFMEKLSPDAERFLKEYTAKHYHQPSDEFAPWWSFDAMVREAELALLIGIKIGNSSKLPRYLESDEFHEADRKRFR